MDIPVLIQTNEPPEFPGRFIAAQIAIAGTCIAPLNLLAHTLANFPQRRPINFEATVGYLHVGSFSG